MELRHVLDKKPLSPNNLEQVEQGQQLLAQVQQDQEYSIHQKKELEDVVQGLRERITREHFIHEEMDGLLREQLVDREDKLEQQQELWEEVGRGVAVVAGMARGAEGSQEEEPQQGPQNE
ncbi:hypothetical protein AAFF_G00409430 [Aldrovandia affinis]|uniref:Uncharacterized protein n=1 Tax=Aldrovandia affinis TaxID=143900 RepID=A0AAD7SBY3_9TELE|nr:hypothetical protein AAFF_G00409430 [Aldrovandia affinis]